jgi:hypothetical protein
MQQRMPTIVSMSATITGKSLKAGTPMPLVVSYDQAAGIPSRSDRWPLSKPGLVSYGTPG